MARSARELAHSLTVFPVLEQKLADHLVLAEERGRAERQPEIDALLQVAIEAIRLVHGSQLGDHYSHEPCGECGLGGEGALREALTKALGPGYTQLVWGNDMNADWPALRAALEKARGGT